MKGEVQMEFTIATPLGKMDIPLIEATVRRAVSNIGSSGQDGVRVDSFFDVEYQIDSFFDITVESNTKSFDTEILSMDLSGSPKSRGLDPGAVIQSVISAVRGIDGTVHHGHVTILK